MDLPTLYLVGTQKFQSIAGTLLYHFQAVYPIILPVLNNISMQQSKPTAHTITKCNLLLNDAATYPDYVTRYHASDMILHDDTDAAYLVLPKACSRIAGHFYIRNHSPTTDAPKLKLNGPILTVCKTIKMLWSQHQRQKQEGDFSTDKQ